MKKLILMTIAAMATLAIGAQTIQRGNKFFDGRTLYTASSVSADGIVSFAASSYDPIKGPADSPLAMKLKKKAQAGHYELISLGGEAEPPFATTWGADVQYVRQQGMNFLAVSDGKGHIAELLTLTPDNIENCMGQQQFAEGQIIWETVSDLLINSALLDSHNLGDDGLQKLAGILKQKSKPTLIERWNLKLVEGYISSHENDGQQAALNNPDGLGGDGRAAGEAEIEKSVKAWVERVYQDVASRNLSNNFLARTWALEQKYTTASWREMVEKIREKDAKEDGVGFFEHDYWTMSQDPSGDFTIRNVELGSVYPDGSCDVLLVLVNFPGTIGVPVRLALVPTQRPGNPYQIADIYVTIDETAEPMSYYGWMGQYLYH